MPAQGPPSRHLWVGNMPVKPNKAAIEAAFASFGPVESVRRLPPCRMRRLSFRFCFSSGTMTSQMSWISWWLLLARCLSPVKSDDSVFTRQHVNDLMHNFNAPLFCRSGCSRARRSPS